MSNRHNELLANLSIAEIHERILAAEDVPEVIKLLNFTVDEQAYDGYSDSRFFKVYPE